jgi:hypothetical protein
MRMVLMAANAIAVAMAGCVPLAQSHEALFGTWKLNLEKSTYEFGGAPKSNSKKYEPWQGGLRAAQDVVTATGETRHMEVTGKFDGKDNAPTGQSGNGSYAFRKVNDHTYEVISKRKGKLTHTSRIVVAPDGKSRTVSQTGANAKGRTFHHSLVWDRQ